MQGITTLADCHYEQSGESAFVGTGMSAEEKAYPSRLKALRDDKK
jgi:hypothetical protein